MAKKRKKRRSAARGPRRGSRKQPQSALILECNAERLERDGISMARDVYSMVQRFLPAAASCDLVQVTAEQQLLADFNDRATRRYGIILVVGHSNIDELVLARDRRLSWAGVAKWLERFSPRVVVVAGCEGGRWLPSQALFDGLKSLEEIYGTPVLSTQAELWTLGPLVLFLLAGDKVSTEWLPWVQGANFVLTGGVIFRQMRAEFESSGRAEAAIWTGLETALRMTLNR